MTGGVTGDTDSGVKDTSGVPTDPNATSRITLRTGSGALTLKPTGGTPTGPSPN